MAVRRAEEAERRAEEMAAGENSTRAVDGDTSESELERVKRELGEARLNADRLEVCLVEERTAAIEEMQLCAELREQAAEMTDTKDRELECVMRKRELDRYRIAEEERNKWEAREQRFVKHLEGLEVQLEEYKVRSSDVYRAWGSTMKTDLEACRKQLGESEHRNTSLQRSNQSCNRERDLKAELALLRAQSKSYCLR